MLKTIFFNLFYTVFDLELARLFYVYLERPHLEYEISKSKSI